jgi:acetyl esterase/lipase
MASAAFAARMLISGLAVTARRLREGPMRPSWSWGFEVVADAMKKRAHSLGALDAVAQRRAWSTMTAPAPILRRVRRRDAILAGLPCAWFEPKSGVSGASTILYLHGGSYVFGSIDTHAEVCGRISLATGCRLVSIEYRLAPEHPFPAQLEDALAAANAIEGPSILAGDSAGGGLAVSTAIAMEKKPRALILISPWVDLTARGGSLERNARYDYGEQRDFDQWIAWFLGGARADDPRASPTFADLSRLPPTQIFVGSAEMLVDQVEAFAEKLRAAGVTLDLRIEDDMIHNGPLFAGVFARCAAAYDAMGAFVAAHAK